MHPTVVVKNLGVWVDASFSFTDLVCNIYKTFFIQIHGLRWIRQYLTDEADILAANALVSSHLATLSSGVCPVTYIGNVPRHDLICGMYCLCVAM